MKKAITLGLCLVAICCSFTGCSGDENSDSNTANNARNDNGVVDRALNDDDDRDREGAIERALENAGTAVSEAVR
ncbi:MAG TPA: hypothetical protein GX710_05035 [Clostridiales bacterium]|nr:hypothetical protein [Clostridiales bacterium]